MMKTASIVKCMKSTHLKRKLYTLSTSPTFVILIRVVLLSNNLNCSTLFCIHNMQICFLHWFFACDWCHKHPSGIKWPIKNWRGPPPSEACPRLDRNSALIGPRADCGVKSWTIYPWTGCLWGYTPRQTRLQTNWETRWGCDRLGWSEETQ